MGTYALIFSVTAGVFGAISYWAWFSRQTPPHDLY